MGSAWVPRELWMDSVSIVNKFWMSSNWVLNEFWRNTEWIPYGFCMDSEWVLNGFCMTSLAFPTKLLGCFAGIIYSRSNYVEVRDSLNGIFAPCAWWARGLARWESSWDVAVAAAVIWKFRSTFKPGNYIWHFPMVLGSWWEIIENGDRGSTQNFDTNLVSIVVWPGEPFWKKCLCCTYFQGCHVHFSRNTFPK